MPSRRRRRINPRALFRKAFAEGLEGRILLSAAYSITDLTPLTGTVSSSAFAIDAKGDVGGKSVDSGGNSTATVWLAGQGPTALFGQNGVVNASDGDNFIVGSAFNSNINNTEAALWTSTGAPTPVGILPGDVRSTALGVDKFGDVIGVSFDSSSNEHAFLATPSGGIQRLDPFNLGFYQNSFAGGINNMGEIVGDAQFDSTGDFEAFRFSPSSGTQFGLIPGGAYSFGTAINSTGDVVGDGNAGGTSIPNEAFLWTASSPNPVGIGSFISSQQLTIPTGVNAADQIVGYGSDGTNSTAFFWSNGTYHPLDSLIPVNSGWTALTEATGINDAGQISGFGVINGQTHAFLLTPAASSSSTPVGSISAQDVTFSGGTQQTITVVYNDGSAPINISSIDTTDITVQGPSGNLAITDVTTNGSGNSVIATYTVAAPSGTFGFADNGTYSITLNANAVTDNNSAGNQVAFASFHVNIPFSSADALSATLFAADVNTIGSSTSLAFVLYIDTVANIDPSTIDGSDLTVSGPGGNATVSLTNEAPVGNNSAYLVEYTITAPGGVWTAADAGTYTVSLAGGAVKDVDGNPVQANGTSFSVNDVEDLGFGSTPQGGTQTGSINVTFQAQDLLIEPTGGILLVGSQSASFGQSQGVLEQLTSDGSVDTSFNTTGIVNTPANLNAQFFSAAIESNGDIVAAGARNGSFFVARYFSDGTLDTSFGSSGYATAAFPGGTATAYSVNVAADGSIVLTGAAGSVFGLARFTSQGALDPSFNPGGIDDSTFLSGGQMTLSTGAAGLISSSVLQGDGKILGVGGSGTSVDVFRLNPDGSRDVSFGSDGLLTVPQLVSQDSDGTPEGQGIALTAGGNILVCGEPAGGGLSAVRLTPTGQVDTSFGAGGISTTSFGGTNENADAVLVNPNTGEYVLIGTTNAGGINQLAIAAFNSDGSIDTSFGTSGNGHVSLPVPGASSASMTRAFHPQLSDFAIASLQNGNIVVGGTSQQASVVRRIQSTGISKANGMMVGKIGKKTYKLAPIALPDGTVITINVTGGGGTLSTLGNQIALTLSGSPNVTIKARGGSGTFTLSNVTITGNLTSFTAPATLAGTLSVTGRTGRISLGNITGMVRAAGSITSISALNLSGAISAASGLGTVKLANVAGTVAAGGNINSFSAASLSSATILAGANLGADGMIGGADADAYGPGQILNFKVLGGIATSFIGAGVNPVDTLFGNGNDALLGAKSKINAITIRGGIDGGSEFESGNFGSVAHIPGKVSTKTDTHFKHLA